MTFILEFMVRGAVLCLLTAIGLWLLRSVAAAYRHLLCVMSLLILMALPAAQRCLPPLLVRTLPPVAVPLRAPSLDAENRLAKNSASAPTAPLPKTFSPPRATTSRATPSPPRRPENASALLLGIWSAGCAFFLLRLAAVLNGLRRLETASQKDTLNGVPVRVSEQVQTPLTWGIRRSVIIFPASLIAGDPTVCDSALRHEQAHIARWDWLWNLGAEIICAVYWFHPGAWWLRARMRRESERACDDLVLLSGIAAPDYASHVLEIARMSGTSRVAPAMAQSGKMEERMQHILDPYKPRQTERRWLAVSASLTLAVLSLPALRVAAHPAEARRQPPPKDTTMTPASTPAPSADAPLPAVDRENIAWGETVEGLQPGFLLNRTTSSVPLNSQVEYSVFVRNTTTRDLVVNVRCGATDPWNTAPYVIPGDAWDGRDSLLPERFRATGVIEESLIMASYYVRLAPGETVAVPGASGVYLGRTDPSRYPRQETVKAGRTWIAQPITFRLLNTAEQAQAEMMRKTPYSSKKAITIIGRDGKNRLESVPIIGAQGEGKQLYALMQIEFENAGTEPVKNKKRAVHNPVPVRPTLPPTLSSPATPAPSPVPSATPLPIASSHSIAPQGDGIAWGEEAGGIQLGARLIGERTVFPIGDTVQFVAFGRNRSGKDADLTVGRFWKVNYKIQIETQDGKPTYQERDARNQPLLVAGYMAYSLGNNQTEEISGATLKLSRPQTEAGRTASMDEDNLAETVSLLPGRYRVRLVSWGVFGKDKPEPVSGWIPFEVTGK